MSVDQIPVGSGMPPSPEGRAGTGDVGASITRTFTPVLVGLILGTVGSEIVGIDQNTLTAAVSTFITLIYYTTVRVLEKRWPKIGWLLASPRTPTYSKS